MKTNADSGLRVDLGISYTQENLELGGSVYGDSWGNAGVKLGLKVKFR